MLNSELIARTEEILLERGWHQGGAINRKTGAVCLGGALMIALGIEPTYSFGAWRFDGPFAQIAEPYGHVANQIITALPGMWEPGFGTMEAWNDGALRTFQEVLDALHEAHLLAKEAERG